MYKMGLHDPFGHLITQVMVKRRVKIWLSSTKSHESPRFPYVQLACNISLESSRQRLQLCFIPHLNWRSAHKIIVPKVTRIPTLGISKLPLRSPETKWHLGVSLVARHRVYHKSRSWFVLWVCGCPWFISWVCGCPWFVHAPKCSNYALTNLLFDLCKFMWVIKLLVNLPNPISEL